jgi:hypothetical protein
VYLMGVARNQNELNKVMQIARTIPDVKQVVSYVKMAGEEPPAQSPPMRQGNVNAVPKGQPSSYGGNNAAPVSQAPVSQGPVPLVPEPVQAQKLNGGY